MKIELESQKLIRKIAKEIKQVLQDEGLSKRRFAHICGIAESTLRLLMKDAQNIELSTLTKLRLALQTDLHSLFSDTQTEYQILKKNLSEVKVEKMIVKDRQVIGKRILEILKMRKLAVQDLSILSHDMDYSDTIKFIKGAENITLQTLLKLSDGLEVPFASLLHSGEFIPKDNFEGKLK